MPGAEAAFRFLHGRDFPLFEISTSYRQFAEAVGARLGFDAERIFCTELDLDRYSCSLGEAQELRRLQAAIVAVRKSNFPPAPPPSPTYWDRCSKPSAGSTRFSLNRSRP